MYKDPVPSLFKIDFIYQVLLGVLVGVCLGLVFGQKMSVLYPVAPIYVMLVQSVVYPYLICSIIHSLGRLPTKVSGRLFARSWWLYVVVILLGLGVVYVLSLAIPRTVTTLVVHNSFVSEILPVLNVFFPQNLFVAMSHNLVPAVVMFSVLFGIALHRIENNHLMLDVTEVVRTVSMRIWIWLISLSPFMACAFIAYLVGTTHGSHVRDIEEYLLLFYIGALFLSLIIFPLLFASLTPISYRKVLYTLRYIMLTAIATALATAALPMIAGAVRDMVKNHVKEDELEFDTIEATSMIAYPFTQIGNLFILLFVSFAAYYFVHGINHFQEHLLPLVSYMASIGSSTSSINAVAFLSHWLNLPAQSTTLYLQLMMMTRYAQVLVSIVGIACLSGLAIFAYHRKLQFNLKPFLCLVALVLASYFGGIPLAKQFQQSIARETSSSLLMKRLPADITQGVDARVITDMQANKLPSPSAGTGNHVLAQIAKSHLLRVGYNPYMWPFAYFNKEGQLVGYDVAMMYKLAKTLHARVLFIPFQWPDLVADIQANKFDIAIGSIYVTANRLTQVAFTMPYFRDKPSFLVRNDKVQNFLTRQDVLQAAHPVVGVFNDPIMIPLAKLNFPKRDVRILPSYDHVHRYPKVDAFLWTQEHTEALARIYPNYTSLVPTGMKQSFPFFMAYVVNKHAHDFLQFMNYWMRLQENSGFAKSQREYWLNSKVPLEDVDLMTSKGR